MSNDTTASASTDLDELAKRYASYVTGSVVTLPATELHAVAAALASAPLPANGGALEVKVERNRVWIVNGNQSFMLAYVPDEGDDPAEMEAYADNLRAALSSFTPCVKSAAPAQADVARDAARLDFIARNGCAIRSFFDQRTNIVEWNGTFTDACKKNLREAIDASITASLAGKDKK